MWLDNKIWNYLGFGYSLSKPIKKCEWWIQTTLNFDKKLEKKILIWRVGKYSDNVREISREQNESDENFRNSWGT